MNQTAVSLPHRPDIDGLRAIAVSVVVLHHAGAALFQGGYVGVDVFFVISGFLITSILANEAVRSGSVAIVSFYERRVRRILPALIAVLTVTTVLAAVVMAPFELKVFGRSLLSALGFYSNFYFWKKAGYFAEPARAEPLLHTWSLAVEEQFYIVWPLLISILFRFRAMWVLPVIGLVSLGVAELQVEFWPRAAFYLLPARVCEFVVGATIAVGMVKPPISSLHKSVLATLGLIMIFAASLWFADTTRFPGLTSLLPALGTALLILCGPATQASRLLAWCP